MKKHSSKDLFLNTPLWLSVLLPLLASTAFAQRPADFGKQWVRDNPFLLGGYFSFDPDAPIDPIDPNGTPRPGDPVQFANSGLNTVHDIHMPSANLHYLIGATALSAGNIQGIADVKAANPNLTGWLPFDEPTPDLYQGVGDVISFLKQNYPNDLAYVNLGGATATPSTWRQNLDNALTIMQPDVISYDDYPFRTFGSRLYPFFYESMMIVREKGLKFDIPYMATMQSFEDTASTYVLPTATEYRVLGYSYLTAGFKGLWNWQYQPSHPIAGPGSILDNSGNPTALFPVVAAFNAEVKNLGRTLTYLESTDVRFVPGGTPGPNLIANGDMEQGGNATTLPDGWVIDADGGLKGVSSDTPDGSSQSLFLDNTSGNALGHNVFFPINPVLENDSFDFSFLYKGNVRIATGGFSNNLSDTLPAATDWTLFTTTLTADSDPVTLTNLKFFDLNSGIGDDPLLIDNVILKGLGSTSITPPGFQNWTFGAGSDTNILSVASDNGSDGLIGSFRDDDGQPYFMFTNLNHGKDLTELETTGTFTITFDPSIDTIYRLNRATGEVDEINLVNNSLNLSLGGGSGDLFNYSGAFAGITASGDFDFDGDVDGADFLKFQRGFGTDYNTTDLADWEANYGGSLPLAATSASVPEPSSILLALLGFSFVRHRRRDEFAAC